MEIYDAATKTHYLQSWRNHMWERSEPIVTTQEAAPHSYTKITFVPDLELFHTSDTQTIVEATPEVTVKKRKSKKTAAKKSKSLEQELQSTPSVQMASVADIMSIFERRAYDISACASPVNVTYNGQLLPVASFKEYIQLYMPKDDDGIVLRITDRIKH